MPPVKRVRTVNKTTSTDSVAIVKAKGGIDSDGFALHWAYVKQAFRGLGICEGMMPKARLHRLITHWPGSDLNGWHFYPELLREYAE